VSVTSANLSSLIIEQVMESQETVSHFYKNITFHINIFKDQPCITFSRHSNYSSKIFISDKATTKSYGTIKLSKGSQFSWHLKQFQSVSSLTKRFSRETIATYSKALLVSFRLEKLINVLYAAGKGIFCEQTTYNLAWYFSLSFIRERNRYVG